jgi:hypothetical protein
MILGIAKKARVTSRFRFAWVILNEIRGTALEHGSAVVTYTETDTHHTFTIKEGT